MYYCRCQQQKSTLTCQPQQKTKCLDEHGSVHREMRHRWIWITGSNYPSDKKCRKSSLWPEPTSLPMFSALEESVHLVKLPLRAQSSSWEDDLVLGACVFSMRRWTPMRCHEMKDRLTIRQIRVSLSWQGIP